MEAISRKSYPIEKDADHILNKAKVVLSKPKQELINEAIRIVYGPLVDDPDASDKMQALTTQMFPSLRRKCP